jgi:uncharacterized coiled-coil protein SlyX
MSQSHPSRQDCTDVSTDNLTSIVEQLVDRVADLEQTVEEQQATIEELEQTVEEQQATIEELEQTVEQTSNNASGAHARINSVEDRLEDVEEGDITDETPTPQADTNASTEPLTPIERLSESGDSTDVTTNVTASVRRAVTLFENLPDWGSSTPKGRVLKPSDRPKQLLEAATDESLAWTQYYRAAEALERLSKGAVTFFQHAKHGKTVVLHQGSDVHDRSSESGPSRQQSSLVAD